MEPVRGEHDQRSPGSKGAEGLGAIWKPHIESWQWGPGMVEQALQFLRPYTELQPALPLAEAKGPTRQKI